MQPALCSLLPVTGVAQNIRVEAVPPHTGQSRMHVTHGRGTLTRVFAPLYQYQHGPLILPLEQARGMTHTVLMVPSSWPSIVTKSYSWVVAGLLDELVIWSHALSAAGSGVTIRGAQDAFPHSLMHHRGARHGGLVHVHM